MPTYIGLDFETYGAVDLPKHGLDRYVNDPSFKVLLAGLFGNGLNEVLDFVLDGEEMMRNYLEQVLQPKNGYLMIVAHNSEFERAVLRRIGIDLPASKFVDSAVVARVAGAGSRLEAAAPQLLGIEKMEQGKNLIKVFSVPGKLQEANASPEFDPDIVDMESDDWQIFKDYCLLDAELGYNLALDAQHMMGEREQGYAVVTANMNQVGWFVDLSLVLEMKERYERNTAAQLAAFRAMHDPEHKLNFASFPQLKAWCEERDIKAKSFDEKHVSRYIDLIEKRIDKGGLLPSRLVSLAEVLDMLHTKQALGGSSLKKLDTIIAMTGEDGRLRNQYLHSGAGQTRRTSGKGVQMQNLKRLTVVRDVDDMYDAVDEDWGNDDLAVQLRQVFKAQHPDGQLIVGDFSSVESRGLAYLAGEEWKLEAYRQGMDLYKVLAAKIDGTPYDKVTKDRRQFGKVGELSCGYGAGHVAVKKFAGNMGTELTEGEAKSLVYDWRDANPKVLELWDTLDRKLKEVVVKDNVTATAGIGNGLTIEFQQYTTPQSILKKHSDARSVVMRLFSTDGTELLRRYFHGCYVRGNNIGYYKPSANKTGDLWKNHFTDPKSKQVIFYTLYGGKLAGLLTQSLCREIFMRSLQRMAADVGYYPNLELVGQFHDEIVLEWNPDPKGIALSVACDLLKQEMSNAYPLQNFPLVAEIKHDHRYTK